MSVGNIQRGSELVYIALRTNQDDVAKEAQERLGRIEKVAIMDRDQSYDYTTHGVVQNEDKLRHKKVEMPKIIVPAVRHQEREEVRDFAASLAPRNDQDGVDIEEFFKSKLSKEGENATIRKFVKSPPKINSEYISPELQKLLESIINKTFAALPKTDAQLAEASKGPSQQPTQAAEQQPQSQPALLGRVSTAPTTSSAQATSAAVNGDSSAPVRPRSCWQSFIAMIVAIFQRMRRCFCC